MGVVMREWMMWVRGGASGEGKVGGRVLNARMSGGRILYTVQHISSSWTRQEKARHAPIQLITPILPHHLLLPRAHIRHLLTIDQLRIMRQQVKRKLEQVRHRFPGHLDAAEDGVGEEVETGGDDVDDGGGPAGGGGGFVFDEGDDEGGGVGGGGGAEEEDAGGEEEVVWRGGFLFTLSVSGAKLD